MTLLQIILLISACTYINAMITCYLVRRSEIDAIQLHTLPKSGKTRAYLNHRKISLRKALLRHVILWPLYLLSNDKKAKK